MIMSEDSFSWDFMRTLRMSVYGIVILGPSQHVWFNGVAKVLPKRDLVTTLKKIFLGQSIFGPINTSVFFSYNAALQGIYLQTFYNQVHLQGENQVTSYGVVNGTTLERNYGGREEVPATQAPKGTAEAKARCEELRVRGCACNVGDPEWKGGGLLWFVVPFGGEG